MPTPDQGLVALIERSIRGALGLGSVAGRSVRLLSGDGCGLRGGRVGCVGAGYGGRLGRGGVLGGGVRVLGDRLRGFGLVLCADLGRGGADLALCQPRPTMARLMGQTLPASTW